MRTIIPIFAMLVCAPCLAQQWCAPGARWFHGESEYTPWGFDSYVETAYAGEVLFAGSLCQELNYTHVYYNEMTQMIDTIGQDTFHTKSAPGIIQVWTGSGFDTLFHFSALPGDHWKLPGDMAIRITVLDTGHSVIDEYVLFYQVVQVTLEDQILIPTDTIYERIGPLYLYPYMLYTSGIIIDGGFNGLRCYSDNEMEYIRVVGACDIGLGLGTSPVRGTVSISPSPVSRFGSVQIVLPPGMPYKALQIRLMGLDGRIVLQQTIPQGVLAFSFSLPASAQGMYYVHIADDGKRLSVGKLIVE